MTPGNMGSDQVPETEMLRQMFAATVHNIGNVITVGCLALNELEESNTETTQVLGLLLEEMLPTLDRQIEAGTVGEFLLHDPAGQEYPAALRELLLHQQKILVEQTQTVDALNRKMEHVSEVIRLQQHMLAGMGRHEEVSMRSLVDDARKLMSESLSRHRVDMTCEHGQAGLIVVDSPMLIQILVNLMKNSIEALDETTNPERCIWVTTGECARDGKTFVFCDIMDSGPGITDETLARLFEFGFTTKSQTKGGQGVGLHFCRKTLESLGGYIEVGNRDGGGAHFVFGIPVLVDGAKP